MSKRRTLIILLFFVIGVFAISRTLLLRQGMGDTQHGEYAAGSRQSRGLYDREALRKTWGRLLDRLLLLTVTLPFFITALLLFLYTLQSE